MPPGPIRNRAEPRRPGELRPPGTNRVLTWSGGGASTPGTRHSPCGQELPQGRGLHGNPPPRGDNAGMAPGPAEHYSRDSDTGTAPLATARL